MKASPEAVHNASLQRKKYLIPFSVDVLVALAKKRLPNEFFSSPLLPFSSLCQDLLSTPTYVRTTLFNCLSLLYLSKHN